MKYTQQDLDCPQQVNCPQQVKNQKLTHDIPNESKQFKKIPLSTDINHLDHIKEDDVSKVVPLVIKSNKIPQEKSNVNLRCYVLIGALSI